jgi:hypothetical protein
MKIEEEGDAFGDSKFLATNDKAIQNFRKNQNDSKRNIVKKMLVLQHNMKYNKHLLSVYMKAKELFDKMVDEHRSQLHSLDEIYRHLNRMIRENISKKRVDSKNSVSSEMMRELVKDKKRIGGLVKKMRNSYEKLMNVNTIIGVTIEKINEITLMDDEDDNVTKESDEDEIEDYDADDDDAEDAEDDAEEDEEDDDDVEDDAEDDDDTEDDAEEDNDTEDDADDEDTEEDDDTEDDAEEDDEDTEEDDDTEDDAEEDEADTEDEADSEDEADTEDEADSEEDEGDNLERSNDPNHFISVF